METRHDNISGGDQQAHSGEDLRMFREEDGAIVFNPELGRRWVENEISADLYFRISSVEAALSIAREEGQRSEEVTALSKECDDLYRIAASPDAATWSAN